MSLNPRIKHERFNEEMLAHMDAMYSYALYLTSDRAEADDLVQETFLKAYRFFDSFERGTNARAWLHRIMRNTYINEYRRIKRQPNIVEYDEQISAYQMVPASENRKREVFEKSVEDIFEDEVAAAIAGLPEKFKTVVVMRDVEDLPYEEIAEALDLPVGTVRSRLHRARALLFDRLRGYARERGYRVGRRFVPSNVALAS